MPGTSGYVPSDIRQGGARAGQVPVGTLLQPGGQPPVGTLLPQGGGIPQVGGYSPSTIGGTAPSSMGMTQKPQGGIFGGLTSALTKDFGDVKTAIQSPSPKSIGQVLQDVPFVGTDPLRHALGLTGLASEAAGAGKVRSSISSALGLPQQNYNPADWFTPQEQKNFSKDPVGTIAKSAIGDSFEGIINALTYGAVSGQINSFKMAKAADNVIDAADKTTIITPDEVDAALNNSIDSAVKSSGVSRDTAMKIANQFKKEVPGFDLEGSIDPEQRVLPSQINDLIEGMNKYYRANPGTEVGWAKKAIADGMRGFLYDTLPEQASLQASHMNAAAHLLLNIEKNPNWARFGLPLLRVGIFYPLARSMTSGLFK